MSGMDGQTNRRKNIKILFKKEEEKEEKLCEMYNFLFF